MVGVDSGVVTRFCLEARGSGGFYMYDVKYAPLKFCLCSRLSCLSCVHALLLWWVISITCLWCVALVLFVCIDGG